jgi:hypothetical protein
MTNPTIGYPDWQRNFVAARFFQALAFNELTIGAKTYGPFTMANIDSIGLSCLNNTNGGQLILQWSADQAGVLPTGKDNIVIRDGTRFHQSIVVKGSFLTITSQTFLAVPWTKTMLIYETTRSVIPQDGVNDNVLLSQLATAAPIGVTLTTIPRVWAGEAVWSARSPLATWIASVEIIDEAGTITTLDQANQAEATKSRTIFLPSTPLRFSFNNTTGGASTFTAFISARPGLSGM